MCTVSQPIKPRSRDHRTAAPGNRVQSHNRCPRIVAPGDRTQAAADAPESSEIVEPLTDEWVDWLRNALADNRVDDTVAVTIEHCVVMNDGERFRWHTRLANGRVKVRRGAADEDDEHRLIFTSDYDTARSIALGEQSIQWAFLEGRLRLDGDINLLINAHSALDALQIQSVCQY